MPLSGHKRVRIHQAFLREMKVAGCARWTVFASGSVPDSGGIAMTFSAEPGNDVVTSGRVRGWQLPIVGYRVPFGRGIGMGR